MSIFGSLFGGKNKSSGGFSPEVAKIFEKIARSLEDEDLQNSMLPSGIKEQIIGGLNVDELPHGIGEFGRSAENPIPVNGPMGELIYLSRLKTQETNQTVLSHRLGSVDAIDIFETVSIDGQKWDILFFSLYHPKKSRKAPAGYIIVEPKSQPLLYSTNRRVENFPLGLQEAIRETTKEALGIPLPPPEVRRAEQTIRFQRPREHEERVRVGTSHVQGFRS